MRVFLKQHESEWNLAKAAGLVYPEGFEITMTSDERPSQRSVSQGIKPFSPLPWMLLGLSLLLSGAMTLWARKNQRDVEEKRQNMAEALAVAETNAEKLRSAQVQQKALQEKISELETERRHFEGQLKTLNEEIESLDRDSLQLRATFDFLSKALQADVRDKQLKVELGKGRVQVALPESVFDDSQLTLTPAGQALLVRLGAALKRIDSSQAIQVSAHSEEAGIPPALADRYPTPWEFSAAQAAVVAKHLAEKSQVPGQQLSAAGYGHFYPVTSNATPDGASRHRRIEILLAPAHVKSQGSSKVESRPTKPRKKRR